MAVDSVSRVATSEAVEETASTTTSEATTEMTQETLDQIGIESFLPTMLANQLQLNDVLFNFVNEAIDESKEE